MQGEEEGGSGPARSRDATLREIRPEGPSPGHPGTITARRQGVGQDRPSEGLEEGLVELWSGRAGRREESRRFPSLEAGTRGRETRGSELRDGFHSVWPIGGLKGSQKVLRHGVCPKHGMRRKLRV
jgi:hypothetical protein